MLSLQTLKDFIKCTQIMKSILYNIQDVASDISSFTNCDEIDYLVLNQSLHPLKILFKIIVMIIPKYRKKIQI